MGRREMERRRPGAGAAARWPARWRRSRSRRRGASRRARPAAAEIGEYEGERNAEGQRHGRGTCRFADGEVYDGEYKEGMQSGRGTRYADGAVALASIPGTVYEG